MHQQANSNQDSITTQKTFLEHPGQVIKEIAPLGPTRHLIIETNRVAAKMGRQRNIPNERTGEVSRKIIKQNGGKPPTRYRVQNNGYKDTQGN